MKHGPIALIDEQMPVLVLCAKGDSYEKTFSNLEEAHARGAQVIAVGTEGDDILKGKSEDVIFLPLLNATASTAFWSFYARILQDVHWEEFAANPPDIDKWHRRFKFVIDKIAEEGDHLVPFARHLGVDSGLMYPAKDDIDPQFIKDLATPSGK